MKPFIYNLDLVKKQSDKALFNVISTFAGGGGSSTGYRLAGGKILAINEFIPEAQRVYGINYPETHIFREDIRELNGEYILNTLNLKKGELDVLDGSPPCSSFSVSGLREEGWGRVKKYSDSKQRTDDLFFEFARLLNEIQPKVFICENVKGITIGEASKLLGSQNQQQLDNSEKTIYNALTDCGYNLKYKVLNAKEFGVPQARERTIFIGVRKDINREITFPVGRTNIVTLQEAFENLIHTEEELNQTHTETHEVFKKLTKIKEGGEWVMSFLYKAHRNKCARTLTASAGNIGGRCEHHWDNRKFTVKEAIRICSFPDDYYLGETYSNQIERLGRAVPPLLMKAVIELVCKTILFPERKEFDFIETNISEYNDNLFDF